MYVGTRSISTPKVSKICQTDNKKSIGSLKVKSIVSNWGSFHSLNIPFGIAHYTGQIYIS